MSILPIPKTSIGILILEVAILLIINIAAFVGNLLVCIASYRNQRLRSAANVYMIALAITDILAATITTPMTLASIMKGRWVFGIYGCRIQGFFAHFLVYTSMYTLALMAVNRYFRIVKPKYYKKIFGGRRPLCLIAVVWVFVALFVSTPPAAGLARFEFEPGVSLYMCILDFKTPTGGVVFLFLVLIFFVILSMALIIASYVQVSRAIRQHQQNLQLTLKTTRRGMTNVSVEEIKITKTLFILVMAFVLCWIPVYSVVSIIRTGLDSTMTNEGSLIATYLIFLSSAINPYIYAFSHRIFRNEFKRILFCGRAVISVERPPQGSHFVNFAYTENKNAGLGPSFSRTAQPHVKSNPLGHGNTNEGLSLSFARIAQLSVPQDSGITNTGLTVSFTRTPEPHVRIVPHDSRFTNTRLSPSCSRTPEPHVISVPHDSRITNTRPSPSFPRIAHSQNAGKGALFTRTPKHHVINTPGHSERDLIPQESHLQKLRKVVNEVSISRRKQLFKSSVDPTIVLDLKANCSPSNDLVVETADNQVDNRDKTSTIAE